MQERACSRGGQERSAGEGGGGRGSLSYCTHGDRIYSRMLVLYRS